MKLFEKKTFLFRIRMNEIYLNHAKVQQRTEQFLISDRFVLGEKITIYECVRNFLFEIITGNLFIRFVYFSTRTKKSLKN